MKTSHWSNYWQTGQLTSLPQDFKENYDGAISSEWKKSFMSLSNGSSILDLCAGNCAISLLLATFAEKNNITINITAVDAADITKKNILKNYPNQQPSLDKIQLIANCNVENIKLDSNQFDLIVSQYGVEYCDWKLAAQQVGRLLKQNGQFTMITHAGSTEIMQYMQGEKSDYQLLYQLGLFKCLNRYANSKISHKIVMQQLGAIQPQIVAIFNDKPSQLIQSILIMLDNIYNMQATTLQASKLELKKFCQQHKDAYLRLQDLFNVVKSIAMTPDWYKVFIEYGLKLTQQKTIMQSSNINAGTLYKFIKL